MNDQFLQSNHSAQSSQAERLKERKNASSLNVQVCGMNFVIDRGVYGTSVDTELMAETVVLSPDETFMEVGCGSGAVSILLAQRGKHGVATDINPLAVKNAKENAHRLGVSNVDWVLGSGFGDIQEMFNVLVCNPPYNNHPAEDLIERMFWDPDDEVKRLFFQGARAHVLPGGRLYFGWANFQDIDVQLPVKLAKGFGFILKRITERTSHNGRYTFSVLEFATGDSLASE
jgi:release factor glutamine methyltransferase